MKAFVLRNHSYYGHFLELNPLGPQKACGLNCAYCNLGPSTMKLGNIRNSLDLPAWTSLVSEFGQFISRSIQAADRKIERLVISGNGEPTLFPEFPILVSSLIEKRRELIGEKNGALPIVCFTNGEMLHDNATVAALNLLDQTYLKLDFGSELDFKNFNRPKSRTTLEKILHGAKSLRNLSIQTTVLAGKASLENPGRMDEWLEIVAMLKPNNVVLSLGQLPFIEGLEIELGIKPATEDDLFRLSHWLDRRLKIKARVDFSNAA